MNTTSKTSWKVIHDGAGTRVCEVKTGEGKTYDQAKQEAIAHLESEAQPYLDRLAELKADAFRDRGRFPELKVWEGPRARVAAKTKKRAIELLRCGRSHFESWYELAAGGDWWYPYAREERVWVRREDGRGFYTQDFVKTLTDEEHDNLLGVAFAPYRQMTFSDLEPLVGQEMASQGCTPAGAFYSMRVSIRWHGDGGIKTVVEISDEDGVVYPGPICLLRRRDEDRTSDSPDKCLEVVGA